MRFAFFLAALSLSSLPVLAAGALVVRSAPIPDQKAIIGTVEPVHELAARARIGGTVASLSVKEGDQVEAGAALAVVADPSLCFSSRPSTPHPTAAVAARQSAGGLRPRA